jgi:hypothetical protein
MSEKPWWQKNNLKRLMNFVGDSTSVSVSIVEHPPHL